LPVVSTRAEVDALRTVAEVRDQLRVLRYVRGDKKVALGTKLKGAELRAYLYSLLPP